MPMLWILIGGVVAVLDVIIVGVLIGAAFARRPLKLTARQFHCHACNRGWDDPRQLDWHRYAHHRELPFDDKTVRVIPSTRAVEPAAIAAPAAGVVKVRSGNVVYLVRDRV